MAEVKIAATAAKDQWAALKNRTPDEWKQDKENRALCSQLTRASKCRKPILGIVRCGEYKLARILLLTDGFMVVLPPVVFEPLDIQVDQYLSDFVADTWCNKADWQYCKLVIDKDQLDKSALEYVSPDLDVRMKRVCKFLDESFFENPAAYPDPRGTGCHSIGYRRKHPLDPIPARWRLGNDYRGLVL